MIRGYAAVRAIVALQGVLTLPMNAAPPIALQAGDEAAPTLASSALESPAGEESGMPHLVSGVDGRLYLSWLAELGERGPHSATLLFSVLEEDGWAPAREIARGDNWFVNWADVPSICALEDGTLIAHWLERLGEGTYAYGVRITLSRDRGEAWSEPRWLHEDRALGEHGFASIIALTSDTFGATWLDGRATVTTGPTKGAMQLLFRTIGVDGELGPEERIDERVCDCCPTSLVRQADGAALVLYRDRSRYEVRDIYLARRGPEGWSVPEPLARDEWKIAGCPVNGPELAVHDEHTTAAWFTGAGGGASRVQVSFASSGSFADPIEVDEGVPEGRVALAPAGDDRSIIAWLEHTEEGPTWFARIVLEDGSLGAPFGIARVPDGRASGHLELAAHDTHWIAAWTDPRSARVLTARIHID